jgi:major membrane immunogen (membrane-anchored lipoprotein)
MKKILLLSTIALLFLSCAKTVYQDGVYTGKSGADDDGAWGEVTLTIQNGKISDCVFITMQKDGTIKADDYGKINGDISNRDYYDKAQLAVRAMKTYAGSLVEKQRLKNIDAVSGATISFDQFNEAVALALGKAKL